MALKNNTQINSTSLTIQDCYIRISLIKFKPKKQAEIFVDFYFSEQDRIDNKKTLTTGRYDIPAYSYDGGNANPTFDQYFSNQAIAAENANIVKNCYEYLKTLPEFSGAQDC